jgi:2-desacetyl-2-hydroxyethyl bacteriochlorophyllide A dehydrogenase
MKAIIFKAPKDLELKEIPDPQPAPDEVLVRVRASGICGTDVHTYLGEWPVAYPVIPGHEFAGEVVAIGSAVRGLSEGQTVAVLPCVYCGSCTYCRSRRPNFCQNLQVYGGSLPGGFAEYVAVKTTSIFPCDGLPADEASLVEPVSCGVHAFEQIGSIPGSRVLLFGCGTQGLILAQLSKRYGAVSVTAVDLYQPKLELAHKVGADITLLADDDLRRNLLAASPYDLVIDATGSPRVVEGMSDYVRDAGSLMFFGVCPPNSTITVKPFDIFRRELKIYGSFSLAGEFEAALNFVRSGAIDVKSLITHTIRLEEFMTGMEMMRRPATSAKVVIEP